jgi:hypothetical protein
MPGAVSHRSRGSSTWKRQTDGSARAAGLHSEHSSFFEPLRRIRFTGVSRTATSTHAPGAGASMPPCGCRCQLGRPCSIPTTSITASSCPSSCTASTIRGVPCSDRPERDHRARHSCAMRTRTFRPSLEPCVNTGCRSANAGMRDYPRRGTSHRLRTVWAVLAPRVFFGNLRYTEALALVLISPYQRAR